MSEYRTERRGRLNRGKLGRTQRNPS